MLSVHNPNYCAISVFFTRRIKINSVYKEEGVSVFLLPHIPQDKSNQRLTIKYKIKLDQVYQSLHSKADVILCKFHRVCLCAALKFIVTSKQMELVSLKRASHFKCMLLYIWRIWVSWKKNLATSPKWIIEPLPNVIYFDALTNGQKVFFLIQDTFCLSHKWIIYYHS